MSTISRKKLNQLLSSMPKGVVLLTSWLKANGYSPDLVKRYRHSGWLESIGFGANIRSGDAVDCFGALYSLQEQCNFSIHVGARSALSLQGKSHYLEFSAKKSYYFHLIKMDDFQHGLKILIGV